MHYLRQNSQHGGPRVNIPQRAPIIMTRGSTEKVSVGSPFQLPPLKLIGCSMSRMIKNRKGHTDEALRLHREHSDIVSVLHRHGKTVSAHFQSACAHWSGLTIPAPRGTQFMTRVKEVSCKRAMLPFTRLHTTWFDI